MHMYTSQYGVIVRDAHDGVWNGVRYYDCEPNKGMFVSLKNVKPFNKEMKKRCSEGMYVHNYKEYLM